MTGSATPPFVEGRALTKAYDPHHPERLALRGVEIAIEPGEMVAIMGPSGCGKSTLLHLIGGLDVPTSGEVHLGGERLDTLSERRRAVLRRRRVGYVFQFFNLVANLSVADNVELPMLLVGRSPEAARERRGELLDRLGLTRYAGSAPSELSGGEQQRVALARALANEPTVAIVATLAFDRTVQEIADDPALGGAPQGVEVDPRDVPPRDVARARPRPGRRGLVHGHAAPGRRRRRDVRAAGDRWQARSDGVRDPRRLDAGGRGPRSSSATACRSASG